jgi:type II secretory pathway component PulK
MRIAGLTKRRGTRAAAIMLALWALFLLSAMVISWALDINARLSIASVANRNLEAVAMACSGAEVALHPSVKPGSSLLRGSFPPNQSYSVRITGEGGRLNLNKIAAAAIADPNSPWRELLRKYLEVKGVDLNERDHMIDALLDWIDPDNLVRTNGAEDEPGYKPANGPLKTLDEVKQIRGWEDFASSANWDEDFTLFTMTQGGAQNAPTPIDINSASRDVLLALPGFTEPVVDRLLEMRRGPDGIEGTEDDVRFTVGSATAQNTTAQGNQTTVPLQIALGFRDDQFRQLAPLIIDNSQVVRVISVGKSASTTRTVRMVVMKFNGGTRLLSWKEL